MGRETELKLLLSPEALQHLQRTPSLLGGSLEPARTRTLRATYFDSKTRSLRQLGIMLRLRKEDGVLIQTVKGKKAKGSLALGRTEHNVECPANLKKPDLSRLPKPVARQLNKLLDGAPLTPIFVTEIDRKVGTIRTKDGDEIEWALDCGELRVGKKTVPICELELELLKGEPAALYQKALDMGGHDKEAADKGALDFRLGVQSKGERGFALAFTERPEAFIARKLKISKSANVENALETILRHSMEAILANEPAILAHEDGEALHQMRVGLRRLRTALKAFALLLDPVYAGELANLAKGLAVVLGQARDLDVISSSFFGHRRTSKSAARSLLRDEVEKARREAWAEVIRLVSSNNFTETVLKLALHIEGRAWRKPDGSKRYRKKNFETPLSLYAEKQFHKWLSRFRRTYKKSDLTSAAARHEIRKMLKELRYMLDMFGHHAPASFRASRKGLAQLQDILGTLNDLEVASDVFTRFIDHLPDETDREKVQQTAQKLLHTFEKQHDLPDANGLARKLNNLLNNLSA
ncbi:MAG: CHAD domain-containing protein [Parvibaculum sp.]